MFQKKYFNFCKEQKDVEIIALGGDSTHMVVSVSLRSMSEYEKYSVPHSRRLTRGRVLRAYSFDLGYFTLPSLPGIEMAMDVDYEVDDSYPLKGVYGNAVLSDFVAATVFVYNSSLSLTDAFMIHFWNTSFRYQMDWMEKYLCGAVRKKDKEVNWLVRKSFLMTVYFNITSTTPTIEQVFHNKHLVWYITMFL